MGDISFQCSYCHDKLTATPDMKGQTIPCPTCDKQVTVPGAGGLGGASPQNKRAIIMLAILVIGLGYYGFSMMSKAKAKKLKEMQNIEAAEASKKEAAQKEAQARAEAEAEAKRVAAAAAEKSREIAPGVMRPKFKVGDTKQAVIAELGKPRGSTRRGTTETLLYKHFEINIDGGKVSAIQLLKSK